MDAMELIVKISEKYVTSLSGASRGAAVRRSRRICGFDLHQRSIVLQLRGVSPDDGFDTLGLRTRTCGDTKFQRFH